VFLFFTHKVMLEIVIFAACLLLGTGKNSIADVRVAEFSDVVEDIQNDRAGLKMMPESQRMKGEKKERAGKWKPKSREGEPAPPGGPRDVKTPRSEREPKARERSQLQRPEKASDKKSGRDKRNLPKPGPPVAHIFDIKDGNGNIIHLDKEHFPNAKMFLIVNIASDSDQMWQIAELEKMYTDLGPRGLEIIAFPSNSFNKEPLENEEIQVLMKEQYHVTYPVMAKCDVNGDKISTLYSFLKSKGMGPPPSVPKWMPLEKSGLTETDVQWNFEKFLVYTVSESERVLRFSFDFDPSRLSTIVEHLIVMKDKKVEL